MLDWREISPSSTRTPATRYLRPAGKIAWTTAAATQFTLYMAVSNFGMYLGTLLNKLDWHQWQLYVLGGISGLIPIVLVTLMRPDTVVARRLEDEKNGDTQR